jgi:hypothetical protein
MYPCFKRKGKIPGILNLSIGRRGEFGVMLSGRTRKRGVVIPKNRVQPSSQCSVTQNMSYCSWLKAVRSPVPIEFCSRRRVNFDFYYAEETS